MEKCKDNKLIAKTLSQRQYRLQDCWLSVGYSYVGPLTKTTFSQPGSTTLGERWANFSRRRRSL